VNNLHNLKNHVEALLEKSVNIAGGVAAEPVRLRKDPSRDGANAGKGMYSENG
jgi:hypothetical protein